MDKLTKIIHGVINKFAGRTYYNLFISKKKQISFEKCIFMLSFDIDGPEDIKLLPILLDKLEKYSIKVGFAVIGILVEKHPKLFQDILSRGHELINHTYTHPNSAELGTKKHFNKISKRERFLEIKKCHDLILNKFNYKMEGFRIPHFGNQFISDIYPMLKKLGYSYSSSTIASREKNYGNPIQYHSVLEIPVSCCPKHPFCIFDTSHAFRAKSIKHSSEDFLETFELLLFDSIKKKTMLNIYQDPQDINKFDYDYFLTLIKDHQKNMNILLYKDLKNYLKK